MTHELFALNNYEVHIVHNYFVIYQMDGETQYKLAVWVGFDDNDYKNLGEFDSLEEAKVQLLLESI